MSDRRRRIDIITGVSYSSDPHQLRDILMNILKDHKDIVSTPEPAVHFVYMGESSLISACKFGRAISTSGYEFGVNLYSRYSMT
jgi:small-conductance mechanosensitive channel